MTISRVQDGTVSGVVVVWTAVATLETARSGAVSRRETDRAEWFWFLWVLASLALLIVVNRAC